MTHVVLENCIRCKYTDCVEVCPVEAIVPDSESFDPVWLSINRQYASQWPNITQRKAPPADADAMNGTPGKYEQFFNPEPSTGD